MSILFKNFNNQVVYTRAVSITGGAHRLVPGMSGAAANGLTAYMSRDGNDITFCSNPIREVGNGIYKMVLTATETNCDSAVVHFVCGPTSWILFDPVYFQTSSSTPYVGITASTVNEIASSVRGLTYDGGVSQSKLNEMLLSFLFGAVSITTSNGINTYSFKNATGATSFTSIARSTDGIRLVRGATG